MSANKTALEVAKAHIEVIESRRVDGFSSLLRDDVRLVFPYSNGGSENVLAVFEGKEEVLAYSRQLLIKFRILKWVNAHWTASDDGQRAFFEAKGDAVVASSGRHYQNTYVTRYDVVEGQIAQITEYANADLYMAQEIPPIETEIGAVIRAQSMSYSDAVPFKARG